MVQSHRELSTIRRAPVKIAWHNEEAILGGLLDPLQDVDIGGFGDSSVTQDSSLAPVCIERVVSAGGCVPMVKQGRVAL